MGQSLDYNRSIAVGRCIRLRESRSSTGAPGLMPGIDYAAVRSLVALADVLELAGFEEVEYSGDQLRGPCLIRGSTSPTSRSFSANLRTHQFHCFKCGAAGNQLDLWVAISNLPLHAAARDLCERLGVEIPAIRRW